MKIVVVLAVPAAALTAALVPAFAGGSGGPGNDSSPPPVTTIVAGPIGPTNATSASFMFTVDPKDAHLSCALDSSDFSNCKSPVAYTGLTDGQHTFSVYGEKDGNRGTPASWSWVVDTVPPAPVGRLHANVSYARLVISWTPAADTDHVVIFRGIGQESSATQVYAGAGHRYVERNFANGVEHRYALVSYDKAGNVSPTAGLNVEPSAMLLAPRDGASVRRTHPPALRWRAVRRASFYNVQLWLGQHKVLSAWPQKAQFQLARTWSFQHFRFRLKQGRYTWYVWPAFGSNGVYGKLAGTATFSVR
jgi:hypothetical protein